MSDSMRFVDDGFEAIEDQQFTDTWTDKSYYVDYFDEIVDLCNNLNDENMKLKSVLGLIIRSVVLEKDKPSCTVTVNVNPTEYELIKDLMIKYS